jgi:hypothetical protein
MGNDGRGGGTMPRAKEVGIQSFSVDPEPPAQKGSPVKVGPFGEVVSSESAEVKALASSKTKKSPSKPDASVQIGRQLQSIYNDVLSQPIPQRLLDILQTLDASAAKTKESK